MKLAVMMVACAAISNASLYGIFSEGEGKQYIKEVTNERALNSLVKSNSYVVVQFLNPGCPVCQAFRDEGTYPRLAKNMRNVTFVEVNIAKADDLKEKYEIHQTPTFVFFVNGQNLEESRFASRPSYGLFKDRVKKAFGLNGDNGNGSPWKRARY